jgi:glycosyltransferase involved in cell wall biosynthesis
VKDLEVIVVDGGSTDGTLDVIGDIYDTRLRMVEQKHAGLAEARNTGVREAIASYIGFLDGDDLWKPQKAERHIEFLDQHPEVDLTFSLALILDESGREVAVINPKMVGFLSFQALFIECPYGHAIFRRHALDRAGFFTPTLEPSEDHDLWLRMAMLRPNNVYCLPEVLALYRKRQGQITGDWHRMEEGWQQLCAKMHRLAPGQVQPIQNEATSVKYRYLGTLAYEKGKFLEASRLIWVSFKYAPGHFLLEFRNWLLVLACLSGMTLPTPIHQGLTRLGIRYRCRYQKYRLFLLSRKLGGKAS